MKKTAFMLILLAILTKILGFIREMVLAYFYGASNISDAYIISLTIPDTIFSFIGVGLSTSFIPIYSKITTNNREKLGTEYTNNVINTMLILCTVLVAAVLIFTSGIVKVFASGFDADTMKLAITLTRITVIGIYFRGTLYILKGYLQVNDSFLIPGLVGVPYSLIIMISIMLSSTINLYFLAFGVVLAKITEVLFISPFSYKKNYSYQPYLNLKDENLHRMVLLAIPAILGISVNQINILVDRTIASQIAIGGISALNYANRLNLFIQGIFVISLATVMYSIISKMAAANNVTGIKKTLSETINIIFLLVIPASVGAMIFSHEIIALLFGRGEFDNQAISMTSSALFFYSIGMSGIGIREILSRVFYSLEDTKTPTTNAAIGMLLNIVLNIILSRYLGIGGLALATSIAAIFTTGILFINLRKKIGPFGVKKILISFLKIIFASLIMALFAKLSFNYLTNIISENLSLLITIGIGATFYFAIIYFMKIDDVNVIINAVKKKLKLT